MKKIILSALFVSTLFFSCTKNAVTGKRAFTLLPESEMMAMSFTQYDQFLAEHPPLPDNDDRVQMVKRCGLRIQKAVEKFYADKGLSKQLAGFNWAFNVVDENTINAWCMPGGKVVVYTGLLPVTQDDIIKGIITEHDLLMAYHKEKQPPIFSLLLTQG